MRPYRDMTNEEIKKAIKVAEIEIESAKTVLFVVPKDLLQLYEEYNMRENKTLRENQPDETKK